MAAAALQVFDAMHRRLRAACHARGHGGHAHVWWRAGMSRECEGGTWSCCGRGTVCVRAARGCVHGVRVQVKGCCMCSEQDRCSPARTTLVRLCSLNGRDLVMAVMVMEVRSDDCETVATSSSLWHPRCPQRCRLGLGRP